MYRVCVGSNVKLLRQNSKFRIVAMFAILHLQFLPAMRKHVYNLSIKFHVLRSNILLFIAIKLKCKNNCTTQRCHLKSTRTLTPQSHAFLRYIMSHQCRNLRKGRWYSTCLTSSRIHHVVTTKYRQLTRIPMGSPPIEKRSCQTL